VGRAKDVGWRCQPGRLLAGDVARALNTEKEDLVAEQTGYGVRRIQILALPLSSSLRPLALICYLLKFPSVQGVMINAKLKSWL
jgi:hypothetical protein